MVNFGFEQGENWRVGGSRDNLAGVDPNSETGKKREECGQRGNYNTTIKLTLPNHESLGNRGFFSCLFAFGIQSFIFLLTGNLSFRKYYS